jgi:hypothetical protein
MSFFGNLGSKINELGSKVGNAYTIGKKGLSYAIDLGRKAHNFVKSEPVQGIISALPANFQVPIRTGIAVGERILQGAENLQNKLNRGEDMYNRVKTSIEAAKKSVVTPTIMNSDNRIPQQLSTGGMHNNKISFIQGNKQTA